MFNSVQFFLTMAQIIVNLCWHLSDVAENRKLNHWDPFKILAWSFASAYVFFISSPNEDFRVLLLRHIGVSRSLVKRVAVWAGRRVWLLFRWNATQSKNKSGQCSGRLLCAAMLMSIRNNRLTAPLAVLTNPYDCDILGAWWCEYILGT